MNSTESPMRLDHPAALRGDDVGAAGLEDLDQVADPLFVELVGQRGELTMSANPTVTSVVCTSSSSAPSASTRATAAARCRRQT